MSSNSFINTWDQVSLIAQGVVHSFGRDDKGNTPLIWSAQHDGFAYQELLRLNTIDVNATNYNGETALYHAIDQNNLNMADALLKAGAVVMGDVRGVQLFQRAKTSEMFKYLLEKKFPTTPSTLFWAVKSIDAAHVKNLLDSRYFDHDILFEAFLLAVREHKLETMKVFLVKGVYAHSGANIALEMATKSGWTEGISVLKLWGQYKGDEAPKSKKRKFETAHVDELIAPLSQLNIKEECSRVFLNEYKGVGFGSGRFTAPNTNTGFGEQTNAGLRPFGA